MQVAYAIGKAAARSACSSRPSAPRRSPVEQIQDAVAEVFDLRPAAIIRDLDLLRPIYAQTAAYGHFGRELPDFTWERTDRVDALQGRRRRLTAPPTSGPRRRGRRGAHRGRRLRSTHARPRVDVLAGAPDARVRRTRGAGRARGVTTSAAGAAALLRRRCARSRAAAAAAAARSRRPTLPVARVAVDVALAAPRPAVRLRWCPPTLADAAQPGVRVRVRFAGPAGRRVRRSSGPPAQRARRAGWRPLQPGRLARAGADARGRCALARAVADRYAGTLADVLRLAVPPRHARVEAEPSAAPPPAPPPAGPSPAAGPRYDRRRRPSSTRSPPAATAARGLDGAARADDWPDELAAAVAAAAGRRPRRAASCVPDARDLARLDAALTDAGSAPAGTSC